MNRRQQELLIEKLEYEMFSEQCAEQAGEEEENESEANE